MFTVLLQNDDEFFIKNFNDFVATSIKDIQFLCYTDVDRAIKELEDSKIHIVAAIGGDEFIKRVNSSEKIDNKLVRLLTSSETKIKKDDISEINIFQNGKAFVSDIRTAISSITGNSLGQVNGRYVVSFFSVQGGVGKSTLAYALAMVAVSQGKQAMYLNFEPSAYLDRFYTPMDPKGLNDLLYNLRDGRKDVQEQILNTRKRDENGVWVLPPFENISELYKLERKQVEVLISNLHEKVDVDYVFIDLPTGYQEMNMWVMTMSNVIVHTASNVAGGERRLEKTLQDVYYKNIEFAGKTITVIIKKCEEPIKSVVDMTIPFSNSLSRDVKVLEVLKTNPGYYKAIQELLNNIE
ncbi:MAG: AAA family ATPase [Lachnospiraceae bacterium]|nr:AAA family ATPase [Lachnospiraceae bacterium]